MSHDNIKGSRRFAWFGVGHQSRSGQRPCIVRKLRVKYPGAIYHVMNRGDRREPIFRDDFDRRRFLETLGEACAKTNWRRDAKGIGKK